MHWWSFDRSVETILLPIQGPCSERLYPWVSADSSRS